MNTQELTQRINQLQAEGVPADQLAERLANDLLKETPEMSGVDLQQEVAEATELLAATLFTQRHPEWKEIADASGENVDALQELAHQYSDGEPYDLYALECAYFQLIEDDGFIRPAPKPAPKPKAAEPEPVKVITSGRTGTLTVDRQTRAELNKLSLKELRDLANKERHERLSKNRRQQLYGRDVRI